MSFDILSEVITSRDFESREWLIVKALSEEMPGGFLIYKAAEPLEILYANKPLCRIFGCRGTEEFEAWTGNTFRGMVYPEDFDQIQNTIDVQIAEDTIEQMDHVIYRITRKDGKIRWVDDYGHFASVPGVGGVYYVFINDITEARMAQEEKERNRIISHTLEVAEQANTAKTEFLSNMSHEIRTPMNTILGMNEMLLRETEDPSLRKYEINIKHAGNALLSLINDVLDFSKIEAGKMEIIPDDYNISHMLADVASIMSPSATDKGLDLFFNIDENIPHILHGDNVRIRQILLNLTSNAIKYTKEGAVTVEVSCDQLDNDAISLNVAVQDSGIGIKEEDISKLFEAFERIDEARNRSIEGTGLGMSIVWKLLDLMGGRLEVESEYGKGSVFSFSLRQDVIDWRPIGNVDSLIIDKETAVNNYHASFMAKNAHVLLVDDTEMNLMVTKGLLKYTEITIDTASDGKQALMLTKKNAYDLLMIDHRMPVMDGMEMIRLLRADTENINAKKPCIALTANAIAGAREEYIAAGFDDYLVKPVNGKRLEEALIKYLPEEKVKKINPRIHAEDDLPIVLRQIEFFVNSIEDKSVEIRTYYNNADWENYKIKVHALKSTQK